MSVTKSNNPSLSGIEGGYAPLDSDLLIPYVYIPSFELDYVESTGTVTITSTTEGGGSETNIISGNAVTYDGSTAILVQFFAGRLNTTIGAVGRAAIVVLYEDSTSLGRIWICQPDVASQGSISGVNAMRRLTPSAGSHTYHAKGFKSNAADTVAFASSTGGSGNSVPAFLRITRVV